MTRRQHRWRHLVLGALALLTLGVPRLITAAPLDLLASAVDGPDPAEDPGANFTGSAFFFIQGMFDDLPASSRRSDHVLTLASSQAAPATVFRGATPLDSYRALNCLTSAIYYEAGNEPEEGMRAVAQVVLNRVRSPLWPHSVCAVVYEGSERTDSRCQFTFSCDGSMARASDQRAWARARRIAEQALAGKVYAPVGLATFYHTLAVRPGWASSKQAVAVVGAHLFYRSPGFHGSAAAFRVPYTGRELQSGPSWRRWPAVSANMRFREAPTTGTPAAVPSRIPAPAEAPRDDSLPPSTIRPEYRNSGRPLI